MRNVVVSLDVESYRRFARLQRLMLVGTQRNAILDGSFFSASVAGSRATCKKFTAASLVAVSAVVRTIFEKIAPGIHYARIVPGSIRRIQLGKFFLPATLQFQVSVAYSERSWH